MVASTGVAGEYDFHATMVGHVLAVIVLRRRGEGIRAETPVQPGLSSPGPPSIFFLISVTAQP